jgi:hypothetical protein
VNDVLIDVELGSFGSMVWMCGNKSTTMNERSPDVSGTIIRGTPKAPKLGW